MIRQWPGELAALVNTSRVVELLPSGEYHHKCQNCGGIGVMILYVIHSGPYNSPEGKVKWLDFAEGDGRKSGWYSGELKIDWCPVCHRNYGGDHVQDL